MRAVITIIAGFFAAIMVFTLVAGPIFEPIADIVLGYDVVQQQGYDSTILSTQAVLLRWGPLLILGGILLAGVRWALRREQFTGRRP